MLDLRLIRQEPERVKQALARRAPDLIAAVDEVLMLDERWRAATAGAESLRAAQKEASEHVAAGKRTGSDVGGWMARLKDMSAEVKSLTEQAEAARRLLDQQLVRLPNIPDETAAPGP